MNSTSKLTVIVAIFAIVGIALVAAPADESDGAIQVTDSTFVDNVLTINVVDVPNGTATGIITGADYESDTQYGMCYDGAIYFNVPALAAGTYTMTFTANYDTGSVQFTVTGGDVPDPTEKTPESIAISGDYKTAYTAGDDFDTTGMVVTVTYKDGSTAVVENYDVENGNNLAEGTVPITISYTENGVTVEETVEVTVTASGGEDPEVPEGTHIFDSDVTISNSVQYEESIFQNGATVTLTNGANVAFGDISGDGNINVESGARMSYATLAGVQIVNDGGNVSVDGGRALGNIINEDTTVSNHSYLTQHTVIAEGITLTIVRGGTLDLMGYDLEVRGTIVVERNGSVDSSAVASVVSSTSGIMLTATGSIENSGVIGNTNAVTIGNGANTDQYITQYRVTGMSIELARVSGSASDYNMNVYGDVNRVSGSTDSAIILNNVTISQATTFGNNVTYTLSGDVNVAAGVALTIEGAVKGDVTIDNGSSVVVNGRFTGDIIAKAGIVGQGSVIADADRADVTVTLNGNERGLTVSAARVTYADENGDTVVEQRGYLSGNVSRIADNTKSDSEIQADPSVTVDGISYISESLVIAKEVAFSITGGYIDVSAAGTVQFNAVNGDNSAYDAESVIYQGARYVTESAEGVQTVYYTGFDSAMDAIAGALDATIYVSGTYDVTGTYDIADNQFVYLDDNAVGEGITLTETAQITIAEDGIMDEAVISYIDGRLIVIGGYGCTPERGTYAVMTTDEETGDRTYSGFKIALDNAQSGQTITVVGNAEYKGSMTIDAGIIVDVEDGVVLTVTGNITIAETAELNLGVDSKLVAGTAGKESTITVNGTLDAEDGAVEAAAADGEKAKADVNLYSTGTTIANVDGTSFPSDTVVSVTINAAFYVDAQIVYTTINKAVDYAEGNANYPDTIYVIGEITERDDITTDGIDIAILGKAVLGNVTLTEAKIYIGEGAVSDACYTATVSGLTGEGDAAVISTVSVTRTTATIENTVSVTATGADDCMTTISAVGVEAAVGDEAGSTAITAGAIVFVGEAITTSEIRTVSVSAGAELVIDSEADVVIVAAEGFTNDGTVTIQNTVAASGTIGGTVIVDEEAILNVNGTLVITGDLTVTAVEDREATLNVRGTLQLGETPEMLGAVGSSNATLTGEAILGENGMVVSYANSSVADAVILDNAEDAAYTAYVVNGITVATVYGNGDIITGNPVVAAVMGMDDLAVWETVGEEVVPSFIWQANGEDVPSGINDIGKYDEVSAEIDYAGVFVTVSVGPRITVSIDGIVYNSLYGGLALTIGTHTVSAIVDPGYTGDVSIVFNGQTVTGGQIQVTSDMLGDDVVLSVTGNINQDSTVVVDGGDADSGMGLTEYLLIILVVLIVIMAIIVALRLMRS